MLICLVECYCLTLPHCWYVLERIESKKHSWRRYKQILLKHIYNLFSGTPNFNFKLLQHLLGISEGCCVPVHVLGDASHSGHRWDNKDFVVLHGIPDRGVLLPVVRYGPVDQATEESSETVSFSAQKTLIHLYLTEKVEVWAVIARWEKIIVPNNYQYILLQNRTEVLKFQFVFTFCRWGILLGYNYFVLICKCALQVILIYVFHWQCGQKSTKSLFLTTCSRLILVGRLRVSQQIGGKLLLAGSAAEYSLPEVWKIRARYCIES